MNTNIIKSGAIFIAGIGTGAIGYRIYMKKVILKQYEEMVQDEIASVRESVARKYPDEDMDNRPKTMGKTSSTLDMNKEHYKHIARNYGDITPENAMADPIEFPNNGNEESEYYKHEEMSRNANNHSSDIYVVSIEDYLEHNDGYDSITIYYYEDDEVLADENEEVIADPASIVGDEALDSFGKWSDDPEVVYVRNEKLMIDYEIIRVSKSYSETVLGFKQPEPPKRIKDRDLDE